MYNGWSNYETWCCKLWLDNDEDLYNDIQDWLSGNLIDVDDNYKLSSYLKDLVIDMCPDIPASMFSDLLNSAISEIDFYEIAESFISDYREENPVEEDENLVEEEYENSQIE